MTIGLRVTRGARTGHSAEFEQPVIQLGRHPRSDVRFEAEGDLEVSARHAEIRALDGRYILQDLGSTNGTLVNGRRVRGLHELRDGDVITLGDGGPTLTVTIGGAPRIETVARRAAASREEVTRPVPAVVAPPRSTTERIAVAVSAQTRMLRRGLVALALLLLVGVGSAYWVGHREAEQRRGQIAALMRQNEALAATFDRDIRNAVAKLAGLDSALAAAKAETDKLRMRLSTVRLAATRSEREALVAELERAQQRRMALLSASRVDYSAIASRNGAAVVLVAVEMPDGHSFTGTGFSLRSEGLIVTNRHLVRDDAGARAARVAVIFSDTRRWLPAAVVTLSESDDLAVLRVSEGGRYPAVAGLAARASPVVGAPAVVIGYPFGVATPMEGSGTEVTARATLAAGTVSKSLDDVVQIDAYAGAGSSGSPVFDESGRVLGVVFGGAPGSDGRIVYAVPAARVAALLARVKTDH
jgi:S1-C subfamily serine protease